MARWANNKDMANIPGFDDKDMMLGMMMVSQKSGSHVPELIQNCDLPPPTKLFSRVNNSSNNNNSQCESSFHEVWENSDIDSLAPAYFIGNRDGKMGLLRALRLSQTRAREAQAKYQAIAKERDALALALMEGSMEVFAYRQMVRLLEVQVSSLKKRDCGEREVNKQAKPEEDREVNKQAKAEEEEDGKGNHDGLAWIMAVAFVLGIAGFGFVFGWKYHHY